MKQTVTLLTIFAYLFQAAPALAAGTMESIVSKMRGLESSLPEAPAAEYVLRKYPGEKLIPVKILGGVNRPGVYYLPEGTDLLSAISLSAGLNDDSDSEKIHWNKGGVSERKTFDMDTLMKDTKRLNPTLSSNDLVFVEKKEPAISTNTMLLLTAASSLIGIALGAIAITKNK